MFTQRATELIAAHGAADAEVPFFLFLAYHNVHDTCQNHDNTDAGDNRPEPSLPSLVTS